MVSHKASSSSESILRVTMFESLLNTNSMSSLMLLFILLQEALIFLKAPLPMALFWKWHYKMTVARHKTCKRPEMRFLIDNYHRIE